MKNLKIGLLALIVPTMLQAGETGGGGDVVVCKHNTNSDLNIYHKYVVYDIVAAKERVPSLSLNIPKGNYDQKMRALIKRVGDVSTSMMQNLLKEYNNTFYKVYLNEIGKGPKSTIVDMYDGTLLDIPDAGVGQVPTGCGADPIQAAVQFPKGTNFSKTNFRYRVSARFWKSWNANVATETGLVRNTPELIEEGLNQKVVLSMHELILNNSGLNTLSGMADTSSIQYFNSLVFADALPTDMIEIIQLRKDLKWPKFREDSSGKFVPTFDLLYKIGSKTILDSQVTNEKDLCPLEIDSSGTVVKACLISGQVPAQFLPAPSFKSLEDTSSGNLVLDENGRIVASTGVFVSAVIKIGHEERSINGLAVVTKGIFRIVEKSGYNSSNEKLDLYRLDLTTGEESFGPQVTR